MKNIEVEVRAFVTDEKYDELKKFFGKKAIQKGEKEEETHYLDCNADLRIQKNNDYAKIWLKEGRIHDEARNEVEVRVKPDE